jgi:hypothetical protein
MSATAKFSLWRDQQLILAVISGGWSKLDAEDYQAQFIQLALPIIDQPWAHIVYLDNWQLGIPEIEPVIQQLVAWCIQHNLRYAAQVYCPHMIKKYQLDRMIVERTDTFEKRAFSAQQDAFQWLKSVGFTTNHADLIGQAG